jgi:alpha-amylase/alpha-mannosidase (GH57 family)
VELSTSPFFHPILPLLCDTDVYMRTHPGARRPRRPFRHPDDAADQLTRAVSYHQALFGTAPAGTWPSEGSVSDAMVPLVAAAGLRWMATDELILARTLGLSFTRDNQGRVEQPERLYTPYRVRVGDASVSCLFRDHVLSDLIGFTYSGWGADAAADDFVRRLVDSGRRYAERGGRGEPVIPIILDGENAWEHFEGGGRPFLRALYQRLSTHPELRTVTMAEACAEPAEELTSIFPGSWIDANFSIWIGHADDQRAWSQLADARDALDFAGAAEGAAAAREEVLIAEGSDWFWWYGDDHSSAHDAEFDDLFRRHLRNVYRLLNRPVPDELYVPNRSTDRAVAAQIDPTGRIAPTIDGELTSYFEWLGAGSYEAHDVAGAMHKSERTATGGPVHRLRLRRDPALHTHRRPRRHAAGPGGTGDRAGVYRARGAPVGRARRRRPAGVDVRGVHGGLASRRRLTRRGRGRGRRPRACHPARRAGGSRRRGDRVLRDRGTGGR